jgi:hypothetical protein
MEQQPYVAEIDILAGKVENLNFRNMPPAAT